ncbi:DNA topoisomerase IV subunit A [Erysipelothrix urinaevulpis]|uniref:DNA topoisomerase IV subunit A n=1 Tax=Erysipelothrix urinaevulpis TaxID=2683717 RepID=UPI00135825AE|nr:DNA topoisomerase IV subunit A [Erysipelothrix urinaevulpis]
MSNSNNIPMPIEEIMGDRFGRYSKYIIQERALPDVRDGLKPVQRRILFAMHHDGNVYNKPYRKSAKTVGLVIGNYHPHGDSSVYEAMVRMSQDWKMSMPLVDMQGNNGSIDDDPAAAMRYTEARLSKLSHRLLENIDEEVVPFVLNFDDMTTEPSVLPARYPNLLMNGSTGIAAGYATNIPPFNFNEIMEAATYRLNHPNSTVEDLLTIVKGPDFPTGAIIESQAGIEDIIKTGKGRIVVRAKADIVKEKGRQQIIITELPYEVIKSNVVRKIDDLRFSMAEDGLGDVMDVRDESDRNGLRIVIDCKLNADTTSILNLFYKHTELQVYYNANMVAIVDQRPKVCSVADILDAYIEFRKDVVLKRSQYRYDRKEKRLHILEGLMKAVSILDEVIDIIRRSNNRKESYQNLMKAFDFTQVQAEAIVDLQLYRLSSTDITKLQAEYAELTNDLDHLALILKDSSMLNYVITQEFKELSEEFGYERRSEIRAEIANLEVDHLSLINDENVMLTLSQDGYIKRVSMRSYGSSQQNILGLKEDDHPVLIEEVSTIDHILFFTNKGRYGMLLVHDIEEFRWRDIGNHLNQYVKIEPDEKIIKTVVVKDFNNPYYLISVSKKGMLKKTALKDYELKRTGQMVKAMNLDKDDELVYVGQTFNADELVIVSSLGQGLRIDLETINAIGVRAKGVIAIKLRDDDWVVDASRLADETELIFISNKHQLKRIKVSEFPKHNRATQGQAVMRWVKSNPSFVEHVSCHNLDDTLEFYDEEIITVQVKDVPIMKFDTSFSNVLDGKMCKFIKS